MLQFAQTALVACIVLLLTSCGGILAYYEGGTVYSGALHHDNQTLVAAPPLQSIDDFDGIDFAVDRSATYIGVARYRHATRDLEFSVFNVAGETQVSISQIALAGMIDDVTGLNYSNIIEAGQNHFMTIDVTPSNQNRELQMYLQLVDGPATTPNLAVRLGISSNSISVLEAQPFDRNTPPPPALAPRENPLQGNTIEIVDGVVVINGNQVMFDGSPVQASRVRHAFR